MLEAVLFTILPFVANPGLLYLYDLLLRKLYKNPYESKIRVLAMVIIYFVSIGMILCIPELLEKVSEYKNTI